MANQKILISLTAGSCAGKSHLLQYIRDEKKYPCLVSSTTREPRVGELNHRDYHFISEYTFRELMNNDDLIECNNYGGYFYGVKVSELEQRFEENDIVFVILEPNGVKEYEEFAKGKDFTYFKIWININPDVQMDRFMQRSEADIIKAINELDFSGATEDTRVPVKAVSTAFKRLKNILRDEISWSASNEWDFWLDGESSPEHNFEQLLRICLKQNDSMEKDRLGNDLKIGDKVLTHLSDNQLTECIVNELNNKFVIVRPRWGTEIYRRNHQQVIKV